MKRTDLEAAWEMALFSSGGETTVCILRATGDCYVASELAGENEIPEGAEENENYVFLPDKYDLDLGHNLVTEFVLSHAPTLEAEVQRIFSRRGAYGRFKTLLQRHALLDAWYEFEERRQTEAMLEWAAAEGIEIED